MDLLHAPFDPVVKQADINSCDCERRGDLKIEIYGVADVTVTFGLFGLFGLFGSISVLACKIAM